MYSNSTQNDFMPVYLVFKCSGCLFMKETLSTEASAVYFKGLFSPIFRNHCKAKNLLL